MNEKDNNSAKVEDGILTITMPKTEPQQKIAIKRETSSLLEWPSMSDLSKVTKAIEVL